MAINLLGDLQMLLQDEQRVLSKVGDLTRLLAFPFELGDVLPVVLHHVLGKFPVELPPGKLALVACMRKLIVILNVMIARRQKWNPTRLGVGDPQTR